MITLRLPQHPGVRVPGHRSGARAGRRVGRADQVRAISPRANGRLAFSYHGDIWIANADGSQPARLTAHIGRDAFPRFSPDGKLVAFTSNRMGNDDVFVVAGRAVASRGS